MLENESLYNSSMLLYSLENWKTTQEIVIKIGFFTHRCLHIILGVRWPQKIMTNFAVGNICEKEDIMVSVTRVTRGGLLWTPEGKTQRGRPKTI